MTTPHADKDLRARGTLTAGRNANGTATLEDNSSVSYKMKQTLTFNPAIMLFGL